MAFPSKDGKRQFTNMSDATNYDRRNPAAVAPSDHEDGEAADTEGAHEPETGELKQEFDGVLSAVESGQQPDPQAVQALIQFLSQLTPQESAEPEGY